MSQHKFTVSACAYAWVYVCCKSSFLPVGLQQGLHAIIQVTARISTVDLHVNYIIGVNRHFFSVIEWSWDCEMCNSHK